MSGLITEDAMLDIHYKMKTDNTPRELQLGCCCVDFISKCTLVLAWRVDFNISA